MAPPQHKIDTTLQAMERAHRATPDDQVRAFSQSISTARRDFDRFATAEESANSVTQDAPGSLFALVEAEREVDHGFDQALEQVKESLAEMERKRMLALGAMTRLSPEEALAELRKVKEHVLNLSLRVPIRADFIVHGHNIGLSVFRLFEAAERAESEVDALINAKRSLDTSVQAEIAPQDHPLMNQPTVPVSMVVSQQQTHPSQAQRSPSGSYPAVAQTYQAQPAPPAPSLDPRTQQQVHGAQIHGAPVQNMHVQGSAVHGAQVHPPQGQMTQPVMMSAPVTQTSTLSAPHQQAHPAQLSDTQHPRVHVPIPQNVSQHQSSYPEEPQAVAYAAPPTSYPSTPEPSQAPDPTQARRPITTTGLRLRQAIQRSHDTASRGPSGVQTPTPASALAASELSDSATISSRTAESSAQANDEGVFRGSGEEFDL